MAGTVAAAVNANGKKDPGKAAWAAWELGTGLAPGAGWKPVGGPAGRPAGAGHGGGGTGRAQWLAQLSHNSQEPDEACSACMHAGTGCLAGRVAGSRFMPSTSRARKHSVDGPLVFPSLFFFPLPPERVRTTPNLYVLNGQRRELLREEGTEDKL